VRRIKDELLPLYPHVDDVVGLEHSYGCGVAIDAPDAIIPIRTLRNISLNPNFGGEVMVVSLGCEKLQPERLLPPGSFPITDARDPAGGPDTVCLQDAQHVGFMSMLDSIVQSARPHLERLNARRRETVPASQLVVGASGHMAMELFKQTTGIFLTGIPYRGGGPLLNDLLAGTVPMIFINQDAALPHIKAGKIRPIAVSSLQRNPLYPDVPTVAESGYKDFQALSWSGLSVAKGTPPAIVEKLEAAMVQALQSEAVRQRLTSVGFVVPPLGGKAYTSFVKAEIDTWTRVIKTAGIQPQ
jgi:hypothetical protein